MKTLNLHCDYIKFKALKKAIKQIEEIIPNQTLEGESKDCLVVLIAIEKDDSKESIPQLVESIKKIVTDVKTENIVLYPYAHLSSNLGKPSTAIEILNETSKQLRSPFSPTSDSDLQAKRPTSEATYKRSDLAVLQAPFGYYKTFELKVKGHPLSELSRSFTIQSNEETEDISESERTQLLRTISKAKLDTSKLEENDHRIIGSKMNLWSFNNVAPGMVFWHPKGFHIKRKLEEFWRELHRPDYEEISTPQIMDRKLWEVSGHWSKFGENNFKTKYEKRDFLVKPMNCPGGMLVYKTSPKSYKDFPLRIGEIGTVHRVELSGTLSGLFRVIQFTQDDAHIFCTEEQLEGEIKNIVNLISKTFKTFNLEFDHVELSTRPEKRIGTKEQWDLAEQSLENVLKKLKMKYTINKGDGAFYGAKIDFHLKDSLKRTWQCSTIQLDVALPERFDLTYLTEKNKERRPIMLHRVIYGSLERFIGIITEHFNGNFPLWLSPNQIKIMTLNDDVKGYAQEITQKLFDAGFQAELNDKSESMGKKARDAQIQRFNYLVTVGEKEKSENKIAIRARNSKEIITMTLEKFIEKIKREIQKKS